MSWAEDQSWFGTEDIVLNAIDNERYLFNRNIWVANDGTRYTISKMKTSHIINCIKMIQRSNGWRKPYLSILLTELKRRNHD